MKTFLGLGHDLDDRADGELPVKVFEDPRNRLLLWIELIREWGAEKKAEH